MPIRSDREANEKKIKREKCVYRLGFLALILTGIFEDFPVLLILFYITVLPICGAPARQNISLDLTTATVISSMLNSLWSMIPIFFELCECGKCCSKCFRPYKEAGCLRCNYCCLSPKQCCRKIVIIFGKFLLFIVILVIFLSSLSLGALLLLLLLTRPEFELVGNSPQVYPSRTFRYQGYTCCDIGQTCIGKDVKMTYSPE